MTLAAACGWSLVRSLVIALAAWPVCNSQVAWLSNLERRQRRLAWIALLIPFLCPELWTGYAWKDIGVRLANLDFWSVIPWSLFSLSPEEAVSRDGVVNELLLDLLLFFRAVPVGTVAMYFAPPPPLTREAVHCRKLAVSGEGAICGAGFAPAPRQAGRLMHWQGWFDVWTKVHTTPQLKLAWLKFALYGRFYTAIPAVSLMFLVAFQEFELASLIGRPAWTVLLFDAQVGGLMLSESLRLTALPVVCQFVILAPLLWTILTNRANALPQRRAERPLPRGMQFALWLLVLAGLIVTCGIPAFLVGGGTVAGLRRVVQDRLQLRMLLNEIFVGLTYALTAAVAAAWIAAGMFRAARTSRLAAAGAFAFALPGLCGSLVLSLALIHLLQFPVARFAYKTPLSLTAGLILFLLPRAMALRLLLSSGNSAGPGRAGQHVATLLNSSSDPAVGERARELSWQLRWRGEFWSAALLSYWVFFDLTLAYLLAPVSIVSAPVMLYNQMHFAKNAILSALVFLTVLVPVLIFMTAAAARRLLFRWFL